MSGPVKFTFDTNFDGGAKSDFQLEVERLQCLVEDTRNKAMNDGIAQGRAEAHAGIEQQAIGAMDSIQRSCMALFESRAQMEAAVKRDAVKLAGLIVGQLAPAMLNSRPEGEIEKFIHDCFSENVNESKMVIRISDKMSDQLEPRIKAMQAAAGFEGRVLIVCDPYMAQSDCKIEWDDGGVERDGQRAMNQIEETISRYVEHVFNPEKADNETSGIKNHQDHIGQGSSGQGSSGQSFSDNTFINPAIDEVR